MGHLLRLLNTTAPPAAPSSGDMWYRSDLAQFRGSDGGSGEQLTIGPTGNVSVIASTRWHGIGTPYGNAGTVNLPDGRLYAIPFWPGRICTLTGSAFNVTLALVGGIVRMGLYNSDGALPTASARSSWDPVVTNAAATITANNNAYFIDGVGGALPASYGAPTGADQGPCVTLQLT